MARCGDGDANDSGDEGEEWQRPHTITSAITAFVGGRVTKTQLAALVKRVAAQPRFSDCVDTIGDGEGTWAWKAVLLASPTAAHSLPEYEAARRTACVRAVQRGLWSAAWQRRRTALTAWVLVRSGAAPEISPSPAATPATFTSTPSSVASLPITASLLASPVTTPSPVTAAQLLAQIEQLAVASAAGRPALAATAWCGTTTTDRSTAVLLRTPPEIAAIMMATPGDGVRRSLGAAFDGAM